MGRDEAASEASGLRSDIDRPLNDTSLNSNRAGVMKSRDQLAGDAVHIEPVSRTKFPVTGKNTGKFAKSRPLNALALPQ